MSQRPRSRKRNVVRGNVSEIKRQGEGLGMETINSTVDVITRIIRRRKENKGNE